MVSDLIRTGTDRVVGDHARLLVEAVRAVHRAAVVGKDILKCCNRLCEGEFYSEIIDFFHLIEVRERFFDAECRICGGNSMTPALDIL